MRKVVLVIATSLVGLLPATASATYITFENVSDSSINFVNIGFWDVAHTVELGELWSSDYDLRPADSYPLNITKEHPLNAGETYTTLLVPFLPDSGFLFTGLGVGGNFGFTGLADAIVGHTVIDPGAGTVISALWPTGGPGPGCDTCGTVPILKITFNEGAPRHGVPEPTTSLLFGVGAAVLGVFRRRANT
jgi:hypothetical protein